MTKIYLCLKLLYQYLGSVTGTVLKRILLLIIGNGITATGQAFFSHRQHMTFVLFFNVSTKNYDFLVNTILEVIEIHENKKNK